jgi:hypothetical protein
MIDKASNVYIVQDGEFNQDAVIISTKRSLTNLMWVTVIEYYNASVNDRNGSIAEHLKSESIKESPFSIWKMYYSDIDTDYICTRIDPIAAFPKVEMKQTTQNEILVTNKSVLSEVYKYTFFCSQSEVIALQKGMFKYKVKVEGISSLEIVNPTIDQLDGWDIFKVEIEFIKDKLIYNN